MKFTVVIADDHAVLREGLRGLLGLQPDISVVGEAANGREALAAIEKLKPDVAVLDVAMPELGGIEAAELVHERCPAVKVVMLSADTSVERVHQALRAGAAGYLTKFSAVSEVADAIRRVVAGKRYLSRAIAEDMIDSYARDIEAKSPLESLSPRERQVLHLLAEGRSVVEIGTRLSVSPRTVETYRARMMEKLKLDDFREVVLFAAKHGIVPLG
jgi:DNA-binding NarL/FixJ family response regulator